MDWASFHTKQSSILFLKFFWNGFLYGELVLSSVLPWRYYNWRVLLNSFVRRARGLSANIWYGLGSASCDLKHLSVSILYRCYCSWRLLTFSSKKPDNSRYKLKDLKHIFPVNDFKMRLSDTVMEALPSHRPNMVVIPAFTMVQIVTIKKGWSTLVIRWLLRYD